MPDEITVVVETANGTDEYHPDDYTLSREDGVVSLQWFEEVLYDSGMKSVDAMEERKELERAIHIPKSRLVKIEVDR